MISLTAFFWIFVILFAFIGALRGWAKEIMVTFGVILAIFLISVLEQFIPFMQQDMKPISRLWLRSIILFLLVFFAYQGPNIPRLAETGRFAREKLRDMLVGIVIGALNGYLIAGTAWHFMHQAGYPVDFITSPDFSTKAGEAAARLIEILPPIWLQPPLLYIAVAVAFVFVIIVFI